MAEKTAIRTALLIEKIKNNPILYDTAHSEHKNIRLRNKIWENLAEEVNMQNVSTAKAKWKNLKDSYSKCLRSNYTQDGKVAKHIDKYKSWPWSKQMSFLKPFLDIPGIPDADRRTSIDEVEEKPGPSRQDDESRHEIWIPPQRHRDQPHIEFSDRNSEYDETDLIFLGYSKIVKKMSIRRQAKLKFDIAKIIMEAEME